MIKKSLILLILVLVLFTSGCSILPESLHEVGNNDWIYRLPNNYAIFHINSQDIRFGKEEAHGSHTVVDTYVAAFCYDSKFVGLKCEAPKDDGRQEDTDQKMYAYYLFNTEEETLFGPYTEDEYISKTIDLALSALSEWVNTVPRPKDAVFG